ATARVRLIPGTGQVTINNRPIDDYIGGRPGLSKDVFAPFQASDAMGRFDVLISVCGGGVTGQVGAIKHGIARALAEAAPQNRPALR
ncbi:30S ribosomal protein S9, partial [Acinetobacter baumannii]